MVIDHRGVRQQQRTKEHSMGKMIVTKSDGKVTVTDTETGTTHTMSDTHRGWGTSSLNPDSPYYRGERSESEKISDEQHGVERY
jgi:hypothetical protein